MVDSTHLVVSNDKLHYVSMHLLNGEAWQATL